MRDRSARSKVSKGPSINDVCTVGEGGLSKKENMRAPNERKMRELAWILHCKSVSNVDKGGDLNSHNSTDIIYNGP